MGEAGQRFDLSVRIHRAQLGALAQAQGGGLRVMESVVGDQTLDIGQIQAAMM